MNRPAARILRRLLSGLALALTFSNMGCGSSVAATREIGPAEVDSPDQWYPMNDPGLLGRDHSGMHRDALAVGFSATTDPTRGNAAHFDGGALVFVPQMKSDFTISFWLKTSQLGPDSNGWGDGPRLINGDVPGLHLDFSLSLLLDKLGMGCGIPGNSAVDGSALKSQRTVVDGTWHHVAIERDSQKGLWSLFVDGTADATRTGATGLLDLPDVISFGALDSLLPQPPPLKADISDARLYSRALSAEAIAFLATL